MRCQQQRGSAPGREARYLEGIGRYERAEAERFPRMLGELVLAFEGTRRDALGQIFMAMELGNHWKAQFFTSHEVAYLMASLTQGGAADTIERQDFVTLWEPAFGAGPWSSHRLKFCSMSTSSHSKACTSPTLMRTPPLATWPVCSSLCCTFQPSSCTPTRGQIKHQWAHIG